MRCADEIRSLWGEGLSAGDGPPVRRELGLDRGVLHVVSAGRDERGDLHAIAIGPGAPPSPTDLFALGVARARADAIVTTAAILRAEPGVHHGPLGSAADTAIADWRRDSLGKHDPPLSVVLTRSGDVPDDHPMLAGATPLLFVTGAAGARRLRLLPACRDAEIVALPSPGLRAALAFVARERRCATICVEAGPSTAGDLYRDPAAVDELMLSVWEEGPLPPGLRAGRLPDEERIARILPLASVRALRDEPSGRWSFLRRRRAPRPTPSRPPAAPR